MIYMFNGGVNQYTVVYCTAHTVTTSTPHNVTNLVPGISRLWISGSSDPKCNNNFYIIAAPTPTTLSVVYAATRTTCAAAGSGSCGYNNAGSATLTFANGDKIGVGSSGWTAGVPLYEISSSGLAAVMGNGTTVFNYGNASIPFNGCGALGNPSLASAAVTRHRGQFFTLSGVTGAGASYFNSTTFYYDIENLSVPTDGNGTPSACFNYFREVPVLSGTGGTVQIVPDNLHVPGRDEDDFIPGSSDPDYAFLGVTECQILRCAGNRDYQAWTNLQSYSPSAVTISGTLHKGGFVGSTGASFNPAWNGQQNQLGIHPNVENYYAVPDFKAGSIANLMATRTQKFYLGSTPINSPDYGPEMDAAAFKSSNGSLLMVGNFTNGPQTRSIALCSDPRNLCTAGQNIIRYIADARGIYALDVITSGSASDPSMTLLAGQTAWYTFPSTFSGELSQPSISVRLADVSGATGWAIRYGYDQYLLDSSPKNVYACGSSQVCTPPIDLNIGGAGQHFYRIIYYKLSGGIEIPLAVGGVETI